MKVLGLVTEYNPFHNGHLYHLEESKRTTAATHTIAVMSGNFLQRGEPTLVHKWARAEMAVSSGIDLVVELPTVYACSTAEFFAYGAVKLLNDMRIVDCICFGSEAGEIHTLKRIAELLVDAPQEFNSFLKEEMKLGFTYPEARSRAIIRYYREFNNPSEVELSKLSSIIKSPNNILSIEYLKSLIRINSNIEPHTILRKKADYHSKEFFKDIASATAIREHIRLDKPFEALQNVMPLTAFKMLEKCRREGLTPIFGYHFEQQLLSILRRETPSNLRRFFDVNEGLEHRIFQCAQESRSLQELYDCIKSKRYTLTRVQRIAMHILLNITKEEIEFFNDEGGPQYIRVLSFNDKGRELLKLMKQDSHLPIISKVTHYRPQTEASRLMLEIDIKASNIYRLAIPNREFSSRQLDYVMSPVYVKDNE